METAGLCCRGPQACVVWGQQACVVGGSRFVLFCVVWGQQACVVWGQ